MRIRPYLNLVNVIDGAVINFVDITDRHPEKGRRDLKQGK